MKYVIVTCDRWGNWQSDYIAENLPRIYEQCVADVESLRSLGADYSDYTPENRRVTWDIHDVL